jgi:hypothetical protein
MDWERYENSIYDKTTHWFEVVGKVLQDPAILPENAYNMDETGVMLYMLGSRRRSLRARGNVVGSIRVLRWRRTSQS